MQSLPRRPRSRQLALKWPNDVMLAGGKSAGILIEGERDRPSLTVVIGIGVNCVHIRGRLDRSVLSATILSRPRGCTAPP